MKKAKPAGNGSEGFLEVKGLRASYNNIGVLHGIDFKVNEGQIALILGANGAGKTTTLRALTGMVRVEGSIQMLGEELAGLGTADIVRKGVAHVPQGRGTFAELTVEENLLAGGFIRRGSGIHDDIQHWYEVFPVLGERRSQAAGNLSGGEQQMLAIARALMSRPSLLLLDEPSLGLAPRITAQLFEHLGEVNTQSGTTMLVVEQNASLALGLADYAYVLEAGEVALQGTAASLKDDDSVRRVYLGY